MSKFQLDFESSSDGKMWVVSHCLEKMLSRPDFFIFALISIEETGGFGGDVDWGVHVWNEYTKDDYNVDFFEGYRFYLGPEEHGGDDKYLSNIISKSDYFSILKIIRIFFKKNHLDYTDELDKIIAKYNLEVT